MDTPVLHVERFADTESWLSMKPREAEKAVDEELRGVKKEIITWLREERRKRREAAAVLRSK